jgi:cholesterol transport system auxiliary component
LIVLLPETPRKLDSNRVPVQVDDSNIAYIKDAVWADKPSRLMQMLLMENIAAKSNRLVLNETDAGGRAQLYLSGSLLEFGLDEASSEAVVVYDAVKINRGQTVEKKRFESRKPVTALNAREAGRALNAAANDVAGQISAWVG